MSLPGFIEYLFYGYEQRDSESGFFNNENYENSASIDQRKNAAADQQMAEEPSESQNEESFEQEILGYDAVTGKEF